MAVNPNYTNVNETTSFFGSGGGGGGGGAVSSISQFYTSSIAAISPLTQINTANEFVCNNTLICKGALSMTTNSISWSPGSGNALQFGGNDGAFTGVSSINGVAYPPPTPPPASGTCYQLIAPTGTGATIVLTGGTGGSATDCTAPWTGVVNNYYRVTICFTVSTTSGTPAANAFLFFQLNGNAIQQVHIPYASIAQNIPQEITIIARATTTTPTLQVGLNDSNLGTVTFNITNTAGAPSIVMEQMGAPQTAP